MKTLKKILIILITLSTLLGVCGCADNPFKKKERPYEEVKQEVTDLSMRLTRKMLEGDYDTLANFIRQEEATTQVKQIITGISPTLHNDVVLSVERVSVLPGSYSTEVEYKAMFLFEKTTYSLSFVMKIERRDDNWVINNMVALATDMRTLNKAYLDGKANDEAE
ncbi:MAG: hypothetical protein IKD90_12385 [Clostridiales bacterium]|nr:hypothetical protein [Clostridiales bacterium]